MYLYNKHNTEAGLVSGSELCSLTFSPALCTQAQGYRWGNRSKNNLGFFLAFSFKHACILQCMCITIQYLFERHAFESSSCYTPNGLIAYVQNNISAIYESQTTFYFSVFQYKLESSISFGLLIHPSVCRCREKRGVGIGGEKISDPPELCTS